MTNGNGDDDDAHRSFKPREVDGFRDWDSEQKVSLLREIVANSAATVVDHMMVDVRTAEMILQVVDYLTEENRAAFLAMPIERMSAVAWKLVEATGIRSRSDLALFNLLDANLDLTAAEAGEIVTTTGLVIYQRATALALQLIFAAEESGHSRPEIRRALTFGSVYAAALTHLPRQVHQDAVSALWRNSSHRAEQPRSTSTAPGLPRAEALASYHVELALSMIDTTTKMLIPDREAVLALTVGAVLSSRVLGTSLAELESEMSGLWDSLRETPPDA